MDRWLTGKEREDDSQMYLSEIDLEKVAQFCSLFKKSSSVCMLHFAQLQDQAASEPYAPPIYTHHTQTEGKRER